MPYKSNYTRKTVKMGGSRTPKKVMGSKGVPAKLKGSHNKSKRTKRTKFPA